MEQDVLGFDVAMDQPMSVGVLQGGGHLAHDVHRLVDGKLLFPGELLAEGLTPDVRHNVEEESVYLAGVVQGKDVGMREPGGDPDLAGESFGAEEGAQLGAEHLDGHFAVVLQVMSEVDRSHPTVPELVLDGVATGEASSETV